MGQSPNQSHDCWRVRNRTNKSERHHLLFYFVRAWDSLLNLIVQPPFLQDMRNLTYIHLYSHDQEIHQCVNDQTVIAAAASNEAVNIIFHYLWKNFPEPLRVTNSRASSSGQLSVITSTTTSDQGPTTSNGRPPSNGSTSDQGPTKSNGRPPFNGSTSDQGPTTSSGRPPSNGSTSDQGPATSNGRPPSNGSTSDQGPTTSNGRPPSNGSPVVDFTQSDSN